MLQAKSTGTQIPVLWAHLWRIQFDLERVHSFHMVVTGAVPARIPANGLWKRRASRLASKQHGAAEQILALEPIISGAKLFSISWSPSQPDVADSFAEIRFWQVDGAQHEHAPESEIPKLETTEATQRTLQPIGGLNFH